MRPLRSTLIAVALGIVALIPLGTAQAQHPLAAPATRPYVGQVVTMYAQDFTPSTGGPTAQHPLVYHALQVLADNFKAQTGITIKFIQPVCGTIAQNCLTQTQTYYTAQIAAGTAPDVAIQVNSPIAATAGY